MKYPNIIAIDGPAASGKTTIANQLAEKWGYLFFDTGVMYRAVTWLALHKNISTKDEALVIDLANSIKIDVASPSKDDGREYDVIADGIDVTWEIRKKKVDFLLAVGGGSVIDGTKFIAIAAPYNGKKPWNLLAKNKARDLKTALPLGTVLTLPATGSEMNNNSVISRRSKEEKFAFASELLYPVFSILDPETTFSLPLKQVRNGLVDAFVHVMEQYVTYPAGAALQDRQAEAILQTLIEISPKAMQIPPNYDARASFMWAATNALNRLIQTTFRSKAKDFAARPYRKIPKPMGREGILYGDKVINTQNMWRADVWPKDGALRYVANGEIGIVVGQFKGRNAKYKRLPWKLEVEFSSQPAFKYGYSGKSFAEESAPVLELAYCLTIHKTQGSEFRRTFVVLPNPCRLLSRELLYTALTRQQDGVVVLHQGDCHDLKRYSEDYCSEAASRLTNLFGPPRPVELQDRFLEGGLIHKTRRGDSVRSKSEVIIADLLYSKNIEYHYELRLVGQDGTVRYPDFTIEDDETGQIIYWEHLGMMRNPTYRRRWQSKLAWYRTQGILPWEEGGGRHGILLITRDDERGGIDVKAIERLIEEILG